MVSNWKPGDVAMVRKDGAERPAIRSMQQRWWLLDTGTWTETVEPLRPLVVIDPEDREQVERLLHDYHRQSPAADGSECGGYCAGYVDQMQAALASPTPQIDEPTALYTVVLDNSGHEWCHIGGQVWRSLTSSGQFMVEKHWHDSSSPLAGNVVEILSQGVTP